MSRFPNRRWLVIPATEVENVDFNQVLESSADTLRYSIDGSETFVKYEVIIVEETYTQTFTDPETQEEVTTTVEAVIQSDYTEVNGTIFANYPAGNLQTFFSGRYIGLYLANNSTYLGSSPFTTVLPEYTTDPIHFVAQREGTTTRLYLNGVLKKTGSSSSTIGDTSAAFRVGANTSGGEDFLGDIFVVKVYNRALTEAEIRNNFNFHKSRFNI